MKTYQSKYQRQRSHSSIRSRTDRDTAHSTTGRRTYSKTVKTANSFHTSDSSRSTQKPGSTSWHKVAPWYSGIVGENGHYYHKHVVLPGLLRLLKLGAESELLDLACGQGVLSRAVPQIQRYLGLDNAAALISVAENQNRLENHEFAVSDVTKPWRYGIETFTHAACVLALQNIAAPDQVIKNAAAALKQKGTFVIVLNHPSFRIPRQSGWKIDEQTNQQYRWQNRYMSALKVPIEMSPGQQAKRLTWSFHRPLQDYVQMLVTAGFVITGLEEWLSDKSSVGKVAKMENRAREEFPLFLAIVAEKTGKSIPIKIG